MLGIDHGQHEPVLGTGMSDRQRQWKGICAIDIVVWCTVDRDALRTVNLEADAQGALLTPRIATAR